MIARIWHNLQFEVSRIRPRLYVEPHDYLHPNIDHRESDRWQSDELCENFHPIPGKKYKI